MRIAALGDAHLGRSYLPVAVPDLPGVNQREHDFERSFEAAIALALAQEPDVLIWLGDIFDRPNPTYRSFRVAQRALLEIREHGVPVVVISGNHDTPRLPGTGSPYSPLADAFGVDHGGNVHFATRATYERVDLGDLVVHAVPQMLTVDATLEALDQADQHRSLDATNLLLTHPRLPQVEPRYADINEIEVDAGRLRADLVLLGHYHTHQRVQPGMWYAGSTDTFTFADEPEAPKGIVVLDTTTGECHHVPLTGQRPLLTLPTVNALGLSHTELRAAVLDRMVDLPEGGVARLYLDGVDPEAYRLLDLDEVREASSALLHLKVEPQFVGVAVGVELPDLNSIVAGWERFVDGQDLTGFERPRIVEAGRGYLDRAVHDA